MSKIIRLTPDLINQARQEFEEALTNGKFADGKIEFKKTFSHVDRKATVVFSEKAWIKQDMLVSKFPKEIAWHGLAYRGEDDTYIIEDIMVYPQVVTGGDVETDQVEYQTWLYAHDDKTFASIRYQGHSHVTMGVTPSAVDRRWYQEIIDQLGEDMFYIFMIWNKRGEKTIMIYDMLKNCLFETADVDVKVAPGELGLLEFLSDAKDKVKEKAPAYNYGNYGGYGTGYKPQTQTTPAQPQANKTAPATTTGATPTTKETKPESETKATSPAPALPSGTKPRIGAGWCGRRYLDDYGYEDEDEDDPYDYYYHRGGK